MDENSSDDGIGVEWIASQKLPCAEEYTNFELSGNQITESKTSVVTRLSEQGVGEQQGQSGKWAHHTSKDNIDADSSTCSSEPIIPDPVTTLLSKYKGEIGSSPPTSASLKRLHSIQSPVQVSARSRTFSSVPIMTELQIADPLRPASQPASLPRVQPRLISDQETRPNSEQVPEDRSPSRKHIRRLSSDRPTLSLDPPFRKNPPNPSTQPQLTDIEDVASEGWRPIAFRNSRVHRFVVLNVKGLCLEVASKSSKSVIRLAGSWAHTEVIPGDIVHVLHLPLSGGPKVPPIDEEIVISDSNDWMLIVNPDTLVSCTAVAESLDCERAPVLKQRVRGPGALAKQMVYGSILHSLIQTMLTSGTSNSQELQSQLKTIIDSYTEELALASVGLEDAIKELLERIPPILAWANDSRKPRAVKHHRGQGATTIEILRVRHIEEDIRSPWIGLKGKIDATVEVGVGTERALAPLEIKTGKNRNSLGHRAQAILYILLLAERHPANTHPWSLLWYSDENSMTMMLLKLAEVRGLLQRRNIMARAFLSPRLPPILTTGSSRPCEWCDALGACIVYQAAESTTLPDGAGIAHAVEELDLSPEHVSWFTHWDRLVTLESEPAFRRSLVTPWWVGDPAVPFYQVLRLCGRHSSSPLCWIYELSSSGNEGRYSAGDFVVLSTAKQLAVARGSVILSEDSKIMIEVDVELLKSQAYRLDRDDYTGSAANARFNLLALLTSDDQARLRELVVDLAKPAYELRPPQITTSDNFSFNADQNRAIDRVIGARDYALILGMPGSGKTSVVAALIAALVEHGKSVLVTGYTNMAVDNILLKLVSRKVPYLRLSRARSFGNILPKVQEHSRPQAEALTVPVVAATALGTGRHAIFALRRFDYCIVDEASQVTLPVCLGPLLCANKFVLVGDHYQLPPLVQNDVAKREGLNVSLFRRLCDAHPQAVAALTHQYRMCEDIMLLSSKLIYNDRLVCGSPEVARQRLELPRLKSMALPSWLASVLNPENKVVFLDTDSHKRAVEKQHLDGTSNPGEAALITQICMAIVQAGLAPELLGVISMYRQQLQLLQGHLRAYPEIEVLTADQSQGRDKECIVISLVRSNSHGNTGELLRDWRRLNVAFTRAKSKLVIVGSRSTLSSTATPDLAKFIDLMKEKDWILPVSS